MTVLRFVLFDLDGTLVNSSPLHELAYREAMAEHRPEWLATFHYDRVAGRTTDEVFGLLGAQDPVQRARLVAAKRAAFARLADQRGIAAFPGAHRLLGALRRRGVAVIVVTSASRDGARYMLRESGLATYVRGVIGAEDVTHGKPAPDPYLLALRRFGLRASEGMVVEDAAAGLESARRAGMRAIRIHGSPDARLRMFPWVRDFRALERLLLRAS